MIEIARDVLTDEQCTRIINISETLPKSNTVYQSYQTVDITKCYIKPHILDILKESQIDVPEDCSVEVLKYKSGSSNMVHVDANGDHTLDSGAFKSVEWKMTGIVLLNDDFDGGELYFPRQFRPREFGKGFKRHLIRFTAGNSSLDFAHGVREVRNGTRYVLVFRYI